MDTDPGYTRHKDSRPEDEQSAVRCESCVCEGDVSGCVVSVKSDYDYDEVKTKQGLEPSTPA